MEASVVGLIISNAKDEDIDSLFEANSLLEESVERNDKIDVQVDLDMNFHKKMGAITHNILISILYSKILDFISGDTKRMYGQTTNMGRLSVKVHYNICKALKKRNRERAMTEIKLAMQNHVLDTSIAIDEYEKAE